MKTYTLNFDKLPFETLLKKNSKKNYHKTQRSLSEGSNYSNFTALI